MKNGFQEWDYLFVETMFVIDPQNPQELSDRVLFFDHYAKEFRGRRSDLDHYFAKLTSEGWELAMGPWSYDDRGGKANGAARTPHPMLRHLSLFYRPPGRKLYKFKRSVER